DGIRDGHVTGVQTCALPISLVFVEVKTRGGEEFGRPFEAIAADQQRRISRGALAWLRMLDNPEILFRFDVVEVILGRNTKPQLRSEERRVGKECKLRRSLED